MKNKILLVLVIVLVAVSASAITILITDRNRAKEEQNVQDYFEGPTEEVKETPTPIVSEPVVSEPESEVFEVSEPVSEEVSESTEEVSSHPIQDMINAQVLDYVQNNITDVMRIQQISNTGMFQEFEVTVSSGQKYSVIYDNGEIDCKSIIEMDDLGLNEEG